MAAAEQKNTDKNSNSGGYIGELEASLGLDTSATSTATGGKISVTNFNESGGTIGFVKMLAIAGFSLLALRFLRKK